VISCPQKLTAKPSSGLLQTSCERQKLSFPADVENALRKAEAVEESKVAKSQLQAILKNIGLARKYGVPMCQDTGIMIFLLSLGQNSGLALTLRLQSRKQSCLQVLRSLCAQNAVDPLTRKNSGNNTGVGIPDIHWKLVTRK